MTKTTKPSGKKPMSEQDQVLWDNDPHAVPKTAADRAAVQDGVFRTLHKLGRTPEQMQDKDKAKAYAEWLKKNGA